MIGNGAPRGLRGSLGGRRGGFGVRRGTRPGMRFSGGISAGPVATVRSWSCAFHHYVNTHNLSLIFVLGCTDKAVKSNLMRK